MDKELLSVDEHMVDIDRQAKASFDAGHADGYSRGLAHGTLLTLFVLLLLFLI